MPPLLQQLLRSQRLIATVLTRQPRSSPPAVMQPMRRSRSPSTLAVTDPEAGNLGGGGFATVLFDGKADFLDYRERAPGSASAGMYLDARGKVIPDASTVGAGAAGVPGTVAGLWELHRRYGKLTWQADLAPAIRYADHGFPVARTLVEARNRRAAELRARTNFLTYFGALANGDTFRQPELAATLRRIAENGPRGFY